MGISILGFILVLVPLVVFHEMGHFLMCKAAGVRVSQFAIGFGKKLFGFRFKGTEYRWNLIPLGGYVDFMGDAIWDEKIPDDPNHFYNKSKFVRILILVMGPLFNFLLTFLIFWFIYSKPAKPPIYFDQPFTVGMVMADSNEAKAGLQVGDQILKIGDQSITDPDQMTNELLMMPDKTVSLTINRAGSQHVLDYQVPTDPKDGVGIPQLYPAVRILIRSVQEDSPAAKAGLRAGDFIRALDGEPVFFPWGSDVNPLVNKLNDGRAFPITVTIERNGVLETMSMNPTTIETDTGKRFIIGIGLDYEHRLVDRSLAESAGEAYDQTVYYGTLIFRVLGKMLTLEMSPKSLSGAPRIAKEAGETLKLGLIPFLFFLAILSVNLGIVNLLPIPVLDGGEIFVILVEWIGRKEFDLSTKFRVKQVGFVILVCLMVSVLVMDTFKLIS